MTKKEILELRKANKLHAAVEDRLKSLFGKVAPGSFTLKEGYGTTSGRTDTTTFNSKGQIVHVEFIASEGMVLRDVNNLHQSSADLQITVLIDEEFDPKVADAYYRANTKNEFPTIWLSDVLDPKREDYVVGRLDELFQGLQRQTEKATAKVQAEFEDYITKLNISTAECRTMHLGIFTRKHLGLFGKSAVEEELFRKFEPLGIVGAADPLGFVAGVDWKFSHEGQYFVAKEPPGSLKIFTQMAVADSGNVIFTYCDEKNRIEEIYASGIPKMFDPTFAFSSSTLQSQNYDGMVDIVATLTGLTSKHWIPVGGEDHLSRLIRGRVFYQGEIMTPVLSYTLPELKDADKIKEFYQDLFIQLQRNTTQIPWK